MFATDIDRFLMALAVLSCAWGGVTPAIAGDFRLLPTLGMSEEFNDNIFEDPVRRRSDFITTIDPGATIHYQIPSSTWDFNYFLDYRKYARRSVSDQINHHLSVAGTATPDNFLFVDVSDSLSRVSLDVARDMTVENPFVNQVDQNVATISPYLLWRLGTKSTLRTGYRYVDTRYWSASGTAAGSDAIDKFEHTAYATANHELSSTLSVNAGYSFSTVRSGIGNYGKHDLYGGFRYEYRERSFLYGTFGNSWQNFSTGVPQSGLFWTAGASKEFGRITATAETGVIYTEDPTTLSTKQTNYSIRLERIHPSGSIVVSGAYAEYVLSQTDTLDRRQVSLALTGRQELSARTVATYGISADKSTFAANATSFDFPYHAVVTGSLSRICSQDFTVALSYTYVTYRNRPGSSTGAIDTNRVIVEARKAF